MISSLPLLPDDYYHQVVLTVRFLFTLSPPVPILTGYLRSFQCPHNSGVCKFFLSACTGVSMCSSPLSYFTYEFVPTSPVRLRLLKSNP